MGRFLTSQHILNAENLTKAQFKKIFSDAVKKKGYVTCNENSAEISYTLVFPKDRKWVSVLNPDYQPGAENVLKDAGFFAEALKTNVVSVGLVDSDFAELKLFDSSGKLADTLILGESYMDEPFLTEKKELWQSLLTENSTWEQVTEIQNGSYTFAEDALAEFAQLIGMDSEQILLDNEDADDSATVMHFKKAGEKKLTLNAAFKQVFGEALEPLGFVNIKGLNKYFFRVINDQIIQIITIINEKSKTANFKSFSVFAGIATVYRPDIDFKKYSSFNTNWLKNICEYYSCIFPEKHGDDIWNKLYQIPYEPDNKSDIIKAVKYALKMTEQIVIPEFDNVVDLESCLMFLRKFGGWLNIFNDEDNFGSDNIDNHYNEGMLYIKTNYQGNFMELIKSKEEYNRISDILKSRNINGYTENYNEYYSRELKYAFERRRLLDKILDNPQIYSNAIAELERRKKANIERLRAYGIIM